MQRQTQLANELWPLLLPRITPLLAGLGGTGGSGSGSGMVAHALGGGQHTGTLADSQAPQFLKSDGSRPLAGNLAVNPGITIDGVDISAHASDPDAHHARQHNIVSSAEHTVTGSQWQIVGLTANNTLGLLTPSAAPGANTVVRTNASSAVQLTTLTVTDDLFMDGVLDFGVNTVYEDATYLRFEGSKALRIAPAIGNDNWTIYAAGGATFRGSVEILNGGDLTVIGSGAYAGLQVLFVDSSGGNVGINRAPDSQFALDIAGPARADYWIGPHAIQLSDVLLLAHFDGRQPFETNYTGEPNGHMGQTAIVSNGVIFRPGKWGTKAVQLAEYTVNLVTNPSFEADAAGWGTYNGGSINRSSTQALYGSYALACLTAAANHGAQTSVGGLTANAGHVASAWVYSDNAITVGIGGTDNIDRDYGNTTKAIPAATWTRVTHFFTTDSHTTATIRIYATTAAVFYVDGAQVERKDYATPYVDGSLGGYDTNGAWAATGYGHQWLGTAHASASARIEGRLAYTSTGNLGELTGTVMCWVRLDALSGARTLWASSDNGGLAVVASGSALEVSRKNTELLLSISRTWTIGQWYHVAVTWEARAVKAYINGVQVGAATAAGDIVMPAQIYLGRFANDTYTLNGLIDDFVSLSAVLPAEKILSVVESDAPVFAESSVFVFRPTAKGLIWADDEGLWMRDVYGNPVLGVYGGEAASKSWGGFALAVGDLVIGRNAVGSAALMWDQSTGKFGWYGGGNGTPQVEIGTDGRITAINANLSGAITANSGSIEGTLTIGTYGKIQAGATEISNSGIGLPRTTVVITSAIPEPGYGTPPNLSPSSAQTLVFRDTPDTFDRNGAPFYYEYPGNTLLRIYSSSNHWVPPTDPTFWYHYLDGVIEMPAITEAGDSNAYWRRLWVIAPTVVLDAASDVTIDAPALRLASLTTSTAAVGAYAGKVKVNIGGTDRWIPYYAS